MVVPKRASVHDRRRIVRLPDVVVDAQGLRLRAERADDLREIAPPGPSQDLRKRRARVVGIQRVWSWPDSVDRSTLVRVRYRSGVVPWGGGLRDEPRPSLGAVIVRLDISVTGGACRDPSASPM